ncbi:putative tape measure protein [Achromobacter phage vB_AxyP_19-32_Axy22]|uniref:Putative tape measure protein n=1 Tax=Achromobacter phage vB_AxyP_19-32_Axy22 TaxID=2591046 RepID=A0A514CVV7_9CAUD|nr:putative tape measure protein [Achromobacter phage vB_AxyP_19-32_Axy22]
MSTEANTQTASDILEMSDEQILNMTSAPPVTQSNSDTQTAKTQEELDAEEAAAKQAEVDEEARRQQEEAERLAALEKKDGVEEPSKEVEGASKTVEEPSPTGKEEENGGKVATNEADSTGKEPTKEASADTDPGQGKEGADKQGKDAPQSNELPADFDYKSAYEQLMKPFKANGKMVQARSPEEAIALMQQGANYTRKMQELQPYRKLHLMLESAGLLNEDKLSFLIDIEKKNPEAIKKLLKDANIDPMDIDTSTDPQYQEGNHKISDSEARFITELEDVKSTPEGEETVKAISTSWDQASKQALLDNPGLVKAIHQQRESGVYDIITAEIDHLRTLGQIPAGVSFIQAYKTVGDYLKEQGKLGQPAQVKDTPPGSKAAPAATAPVATRVAAPKPEVTNGKQASAASPSRSAPRKVSPIVNYMAMSDEEILKMPAPKSV